MNSQPKSTLPNATEVVGAKRGGPAHLVDGIGPGKGVITPQSISGNILPQTSSTNPTGLPVPAESGA